MTGQREKKKKRKKRKQWDFWVPGGRKGMQRMGNSDQVGNKRTKQPCKTLEGLETAASATSGWLE